MMAKKIVVLFLLLSLIAVPFVKVTEVRAIPSGVGVLGDSGSASYRCNDNRSETSFNWPEVLELVRGIDFGPGECQAYNQSQMGEKIFPDMDDQTGDTIAYITGGQVGKVIIMHGYNDLYSDPENDPDVSALLAEYRRNVDRLLAAGLAGENILIIDVTQENWADPIGSAVDQFNAGLKDMAIEIGAAFGTYTAFHAELACRISPDQQSYNYGGHAISQQWGNNWNNFRVSDGHLNTLGNGTLANTTMLEFLDISRMSDTELLAIMNVQPINQGPNCGPTGANTTTNITSDSPDPSTVNQAVTVNFTVTSTSGTPSGNVTVKDSASSATCTGTVVQGSCSITLASAGARTLTATYAGNSSFASSSDTESHTVGQYSTTTTITGDSPDASVAGQAVTVSFTVTSTSGTPSGNVTVTDSASSATCTGTVSQGSCSITLPTAGARTLTASYAGNTNFAISSDTEAHSVNKAGTATTITSDTPDPSALNQAVTVHYSVAVNTPGGGTPGGNVTVTDSASSASCTATAAAGSCNISLSTLGTRTLTATYAGDSNFNGSSDTDSHTVNQNSTTTTITSDTPDPSAASQPVTVTYTVTSSSGTPTGNVTVSDGINSCVGTVATGGCTLALTTVGPRTLTASYQGDANFGGSISPGVAHQVNSNARKTLISIAAQDGSILETMETSNKGGTLYSTELIFYLGDDVQDKQYRSILSFSTKGLPDTAVITRVTLKVMRQAVVGGGNPVTTFQGFLVDVKEGFFGAAAGLQASDFQAKPTRSYGPFKPGLKSGWYTIDLTPAKGDINLLSTAGGVTQIRLRFKLDDNNNNIANDLSLYSGNAPSASRPQLIIEYYVP